MSDKLTFSECLRHYAQSCGASMYTIARETGIDTASLSRFFAGKRGLSIVNIDKLVDFLGLELRWFERTTFEKLNKPRGRPYAKSR